MNSIRVSFWNTVDAELAAFAARPVVDQTPARSTSDFTGYEVHLTGLDGYRLFGYLSVPTGPGPFPALLEIPRHGSVNNPPHYIDRLRYVVFTPMHRGQRRSDSPFAAAYPGLFTLDITDSVRYIYRSIVADCLRFAEFLLSLPTVDGSRVGVVGDDLALLTAARRPLFTAVQVNTPLLHNALQRRLTTTEYPLEELNDHLRLRAGDESLIASTLALFDPVSHARDVTAHTLLAVPSVDSPWSADLLAGLRHLETYQLTNEDAVDVRSMDTWLAGQLGVEPKARFAA
ncbi:acetylxylan esterase [Kutzneria sp. CA-103260]|uniref:acetylxylan esterase n=1 Tax=Kutzneria sp. CA-103260 TaxID=2802641 RepID=UPI001BAA26E9|nr:acetylxylan esterase [Kutzneria sp. CA-103260]QUQ65393.1 acetylxylan esterase [Kutzneria sp. CA-103260]